MRPSREQTGLHSKAPSDHLRTIKHLGHYLWPQGRRELKTRVIFAVIFLIAAKVLNVYVPFLLKLSIDHLSVKEAAVVVPVGIIVAYGLARIMVQVFGEMRDLIFVRVAQHAQRTIALTTFKHLHQLSLEFHLSRQTGGLSRVIERGTRGIQFVLNFMTFNILPTLLEIFLVTGVLLAKFDVLYAAVIFGTIVLYIALTLTVTEWRLKFRQKMNSEESKANTKAIDSLLNYETVKYFGNEEHEHHRFDHSLRGYEAAAIKSQSSLTALNIIQASIIGGGLLTVMLMAGADVAQGKLTLGDFVLVNTFLIQLYLPLNFLGFVYREIKNSLVDMEKMFELMDVPTTVSDLPNAKTLVISSGQVQFSHVHFGYSNKRKILKDVSFTVQPGKTLAIVGPSGAGKSTISRLLFRFYDVTEGAILIDGQNIREVTQKSLRSVIGIVPQDTVLFNDSIGYNIQYGNPLLEQADVERAARLANIHDFVESLSDGYQTPVGERGLKISGGEKQRVAIARTILKNPQILLFDEATSALDSHNEKEIQASLKEISKDRTTITIAHRLSTIIDADEIIVLKDGEIVERGVHNQLLAQNGEYASMWRKQNQTKEVLEL
ncbi:MAG: metal ABC transporter permease [Bdellovibrio sp. CG10_big_fil_rev_8_21_14_0_10_47_8]|nr:MAG: metal ABC transporter permease [Bdellovibrio sp. CG10_big_fil_rev_8_21_14_0_10_47_8]